MVDNDVAMDGLFHALAHSARRSMLHRLATSDLTISALAKPLTMSLWAASKHVQVLEDAGLVRRTIAGREHVCRLEAGPLMAVASWLQFYQRFWPERIDTMQALLETKAKRRKGT